MSNVFISLFPLEMGEKKKSLKFGREAKPKKREGKV